LYHTNTAADNPITDKAKLYDKYASPDQTNALLAQAKGLLNMPNSSS
jgi:hypothetical protein